MYDFFHTFKLCEPIKRVKPVIFIIVLPIIYFHIATIYIVKREEINGFRRERREREKKRRMKKCEKNREEILLQNIE